MGLNMYLCHTERTVFSLNIGFVEVRLHYRDIRTKLVPVVPIDAITDIPGASRGRDGVGLPVGWGVHSRVEEVELEGAAIGISHGERPLFEDAFSVLDAHILDLLSCLGMVRRHLIDFD